MIRWSFLYILLSFSAFTQVMDSTGYMIYKRTEWGEMKDWEGAQVTSFDSIDCKMYEPYSTLDNMGRSSINAYERLNRLAPSKFYGMNYANKAKYYSARIPFFDIFYSLGSRTNQAMKVFYSQNFKPNVNLSIDYKRWQSLGFQSNNETKFNDLNLSIWAKFDQIEVRNYTSYYNNNLQDNGGISDTSSYLIVENKFLSTNKSTAFNVFEGFNSSTDLDFYFGKDSIKKNGLTYNLTFANDERMYDENSFDLSTEYAQINFDTTLTHDVYNHGRLSNEFGYKFRGDKFGFQATAQHHYEKGRLADSSYSWADVLSVNAALSGRWGGVKIEASGQMFVTGYWAGGWNVSFALQYQNKKKTLLIGQTFNADFKKPQLYNTRMSGNHVDWNVEENQTKYINANTELYFKKIGLRINVDQSLISDFNYHDSSFTTNSGYTPSKYNGSLYALQIKARYHIAFWKMALDVEAKFNWIADKSLWNYPLLESKLRFYYKEKLFKAKILVLKVGIDLRYDTPYQTNAYIPYLNEQVRGQGYNGGNFIYIDPFISFDIKRFSFFAKFYNLQHLWTTQKRYTTSAQPISPFYFRFGLTWSTFN